MTKILPLSASLFAAYGTAMGGELTISIEIPTIDVAEYHRPYIAIWIARPDHSVAANLSVLYQNDDRGEGKGETWLKDLRSWWRRTGRTLDMPIDGLTTPTRAPGTHTFTYGDKKISQLSDGDYTLYIEAVREVGGREVLSLPLSWSEATSGSVTGESELGTVTFNLSE